MHPAVVLKALSPYNHPRPVLQLRSCIVELDGVVVGYLVEEAEEGDLVRAEPRGRVPGTDVHDGDGGGGERRQHQPLPEVTAAGETPALVSPHLWGRSCGRCGGGGGGGGGGGEGLGFWRTEINVDHANNELHLHRVVQTELKVAAGG